MGNTRKIVIASLFFWGLASTNLFADIPRGTAVIGNNAYDLNYLKNATKEENNKIRLHVISGKEIYVKDFEGKWRFNLTNEIIVDYKELIPKVEYKGENGKIVSYEKGDGKEIKKEIDKDEDDQYEHIYFIGFKELQPVEVLVGNKFILPDKVQAKYSDWSTKEYSVVWDSKNVDIFKPGTYKVQGYVKDLNKNVTVTVTVLESLDIKEIPKLEDVVLEFGDVYALPTRIPVILQTGEKLDLRVEWDGTIDTNRPGVYNLKGTIYGTTDTTTLKVTVKDYVEMIQYWIKKPSYISYENMLKSAIEGKVNLDNVSKVKAIVDNKEVEGLTVDTNGNFKVDVSELKVGTTVTIKLYDKNGVEVDSLDIVKTI